MHREHIARAAPSVVKRIRGPEIKPAIDGHLVLVEFEAAGKELGIAARGAAAILKKARAKLHEKLARGCDRTPVFEVSAVERNAVA